MGTTVEKDLKTLRASKLMVNPEYKEMVNVLDKYHKNRDTKTRETRENDLRPYLYDDGDTYEKPFYNILLKLLYEVASFKTHDKQNEDLLKIYGWFRANQTLVADEYNNDADNNNKQDDVKMPKLYLRPKTADASLNNKVRTQDTVMETARPKSVLSKNEYHRLKKSKNINPLEKISVSLKVRSINMKPEDRKVVPDVQNNNRNSKRRHHLSSESAYVLKYNRKASLPANFVLKPANPTSPPTSTPLVTPIISPRHSPRRASPSQRLSPRVRSQSPPELSLSGQKALEKRKNTRNNREYSFGSDDQLNMADYKLTDVEADIFQNQLEQRLRDEVMERTSNVMKELKHECSLLREEGQNLQSHLYKERAQLELEKNEADFTQLLNEETTKSNVDDKNHEGAIPIVNAYDFSDQRPISAVTFRQKNVRVESLAEMVEPVGLQMQYEKEMRDRYNLSIWDSEYLKCNRSQRIHSAPSFKVRMVNGESYHNRDLNAQEKVSLTEPTLNPEMKASDYTVHFPHQCNREPPVKDFKTSGRVTPDTVRYQWADDGFGNRTYVKKRFSRETDIAKRRTSSGSSKDDVAMTTGVRGLDKRTLASLMIIKHLGATSRQDRNTRNSSLAEDSYSFPVHKTHDDEATYHRVEYLPFWKQMSSKKGVTVLNFPETSENHQIDSKDNYTSDLENKGRYYLSETLDTVSPQQIVNDMFTSLSPNRRHSENKVSDVSLSLNAQSISPRCRETSNKKQQIHVPRRTFLSPAPSRPSSARSQSRSQSPSNQNHHFTIKDFTHYCSGDNNELDDDYMRQKEIWAAVNIQRIFRGHMAREYTKKLHLAEKERQRNAAVALQSTFRGYLARKKMMKQNITRYKPNMRDLEWAKDYKEKLKEKDFQRNRRIQGALRKQNRHHARQQEQLSGVTASDMIHEIFNASKEKKAQMKAAAITIQRYFRGWFVRKSLKAVKEKALKRTFSFNKFIKSYQDLLKRIQERYNIKDPSTPLQFHELKEYVERLFKYEITFGKIAQDGILKYEDLMKYFTECGHHPSEKEMDDAIASVMKGKGKNLGFKKSEAVELVFQIYVPKGTGLTLADVRKSTWTNPLINGEDVVKSLSKKDLEFTSLDKCLALVANAQSERSEVKNLLQPPDPTVESKNGETKGTTQRNGSLIKARSRPTSPKSPGGGQFILPKAQYHPAKTNGKKKPR